MVQSLKLPPHTSSPTDHRIWASLQEGNNNCARTASTIESALDICHCRGLLPGNKSKDRYASNIFQKHIFSIFQINVALGPKKRRNKQVHINFASPPVVVQAQVASDLHVLLRLPYQLLSNLEEFSISNMA